MSLRRVSENRSRGFSNKSTDSIEDHIVYSGDSRDNKTKKPERQPREPPSEPKDQKKDGFARFLKKHSSPTHQRVTAGGRIVPMEPRSPPLFKLSDDFVRRNGTGLERISTKALSPGQANLEKQASPTQHEVTDKVISPSARISNHNNLTDRSVGEIPMYFTLPQEQVPVYAHDHLSMAPQLYSPYLFHFPVQGMNQLAGNYSGSFNTIPISAGPVLPISNHPMMSPVGTMLWSPLDGCMSMGLTASTTSMCEPSQEKPSDASVLYAQATEHFNLLDQQLKELDRHRAMGNHDPSIAHQRMLIVEQRAKAKQLVTQTMRTIDLESSTKAASFMQSHCSSLNVGAQTYVPGPSFHYQQLSGNESHSPEQSHSEMFLKARKSTKRQPIPIVPPPTTIQSSEKSTPIRIVTQDREETDDDHLQEWRARLHPPLPTLSKQQSDLAEPGKQKLGDLKPESDARGSMTGFEKSRSEAVDDFKNLSLVAKADTDYGCNSGDEFEFDNPGPAPKHIEALYEQQLDALRLPPGYVAEVEWPSGIKMEIHGLNLKRPDPADLSDFEKDYWLRKPILTNDMVMKLQARSIEQPETKSKRDQSEVPAINIDKMLHHPSPVRAQLQQKLDTFTNEMNDPKAALNDEEPVLSDLIQNLSRNEREFETVRTDEAKSLDENFRAADRSVAGSDHTYARESDVPVEALSNKGYSSTAIQNIHAMGSMPQNLDGADDSRRQTVLSTLTAVSKTRSPRLTQRSTPAGTAWYGPHFRQILQRSMEDGDKQVRKE